MQLSRLLLNIMLLCILATVIVGATWKNALPEQPARGERHGDEGIRPSGQPGWEPASKPRYILASGTPTVPTPTQPPPTPTQPPCECGERPEDGDRARVKCGDGCASRTCVWPAPDWPSQIGTCAHQHEQGHLNDPNFVCHEGWGAFLNSQYALEAECEGIAQTAECIHQAWNAEQDPTTKAKLKQYRDAYLDLAVKTCDDASEPKPTPFPTPDPTGSST